MSDKDFKKGMAAGAKPFGDKFNQMADANEKAMEDISEGIKGIKDVVDEILGDLSNQEKKNIYDLNTPIGIESFEQEQKEHLLSILSTLVDNKGGANKYQQFYIRSLKAYLSVVNIQTEIDLYTIENITDIVVQKAILQTIMEFFYLEYQNHDYFDDYEDLFDCFSVNKRGINELKAAIDSMAAAMGIAGVACHYSPLAEPEEETEEAAKESAKEETMLDRAEAAYLAYDMKEAFHLFSYLAEQGDGRAMYFLAEIYAENHGDVVDEKKLQVANEWRKKGATLGDPLCKYKYASCCIENGSEKERLLKDAFEYVAMNTAADDIFAIYEMSQMYTKGEGIPEDKEKANDYLEYAAEEGYWIAAHLLGREADMKKDYETALKYYEIGLACGYRNTLTNMGNMYNEGHGVEKNIDKAVELYTKAANMKSAVAAKNLGLHYLNNMQNEELAKNWFEKQAEYGDLLGYYYLAYVVNTSKDEYNKECLEWLILAADKGSPWAKMELAAGHLANRASKLYSIKGSDDYTNNKKQKAILEQYANDGVVWAEAYWGTLLTSSLWVAKDYDLAKKYLSKAMEKGSNLARKNYNEICSSSWLKSTYFIPFAPLKNSEI